MLGARMHKWEEPSKKGLQEGVAESEKFSRTHRQHKHGKKS